MALETGFNTVKFMVIDNDDGKVHFEMSYPELDYADVVAVQEVVANALVGMGKAIIADSVTKAK